MAIYAGSLPSQTGNSGKFLTTNGSVASWATVSTGITNAAGANVIPKSDGTNLVASSVSDDGTTVSTTEKVALSVNGALSAPGFTGTGTWITGGSSTTTKPYMLIEPSGASSTSWSISGTGFAVNAASGFSGDIFALSLNGVANHLFKMDSGGTVRMSGALQLTSTNLGMGNTGFFSWNSNADGSGNDTRLSRNAAGIVQVGTTANNALGSLAFVGAAMSGKATTYNNVTTAGLGVPAIYGVGRSTAQTAAVASVATYTVGAADGSFEVSANVLVTTATTHNFTVTCAYTDEGNTARTITFNFSSLAGVLATAIINTGGAVPYEGVPLHIRAKASTAITIATTGTFTTVTYNVEGVIRQWA